MRDAQAEAKELGHGYVGPEHILLGLLRESDSAAAQVLRLLGISADGVRARLMEIASQSQEQPPAHGQLPFTPKAKKVLELALREALSMGQNEIGPELLLLGLTREDDGVAIQILRESGLSGERIRQTMFGSFLAESRGLRQVDLGMQLYPSPAALRLLMSAGAHALDDGRTDIQIKDIVAAVAGEPDAVRLLADLRSKEQKSDLRARGKGPPPE